MKLLSRNKSNISIEFGSSEIKVVEGQVTKSGINIIKAESLKLPRDTYSDGKILNEIRLKDKLRDFLRYNNFKMNLKAYGVINSTSIVNREVSIPKVEKDEIAALINFQITEFLPINPEDYVIDYLILENDPSSQEAAIKLLLIAIPKGLVVSHLRLMREVGLEAMVLDFQGNAISKLLSSNKNINNDKYIKDTSLASIDMGYTNLDITISINGNIQVSRAIDLGLKKLYKDISNILEISEEEAEMKVKALEDISKIESNMEEEARISNLLRTFLGEVIEKVSNVIRYYDSREFAQRINFIVLQGGITNIKGIGDIFLDYFNITTIHLEELDRVKLYGELWKFSNAIGALIRMDEVK